jgi:hypothetical protein
MQETSKRLSTVRNLPPKYPDAGFTESSIRWLIFNSSENGFTHCICRVGRKVLIDLDAFEEWLDNKALQGGDS